jgi:hypothetical protein
MEAQPKSTADIFRDFYEHPFIQSIADREKWSISDKDKRPIDMNVLEYQHRVVGCNTAIPYSMTTLKHTLEILPFPANHAYYLDAPDDDDFVVLDIEPECPSSLKAQFMRLPYIYAEKSMSGKGIHLVMPVPSNYEDYPIAMTKQKLQEEHRWYEILVNHWVTFTRNMLGPASPTKTLDDWDGIYAELAARQKETPERPSFDVDTVDTDDIPDSAYIIATLTTANNYHKTLEDFHDDSSRYEFGLLAFKFRRMLSLLKSTRIQKLEHEYTPEEETRMLYAIAQQVIPYRDKHDETRQGMPWLLFVSRSVVNDVLREKENDTE